MKLTPEQLKQFDDDGYLWLLGRVDDVINVAGHRIGTMEVESALVAHPKVNVLMNLDDRYADLIDDQLDLAIRITDQPPPGLMGRHLTDIRHGLYASPDYLAEHSLPVHPQQLREHSCIYLGEAPSDFRHRLHAQ